MDIYASNTQGAALGHIVTASWRNSDALQVRPQSRSAHAPRRASVALQSETGSASPMSLVLVLPSEELE